MVRTLVLAVDGSECSKEALSWDIKNFQQPDDKVHLINISNVVQCPLALTPFGAEPIVIMNHDEWKTKMRENIQNSEDILKSSEEKLSGVAVVSKTHIRHGTSHTGEEICHLARSVKANCIILGSRGLGTLRRTLIGSTSDYVLHHAPCATLIIKKDHK